MEVDYLLVGGGGGGSTGPGPSGGGGGGAGGLIYASGVSLNSGAHAITVGSGGTSGPGLVRGGNGTNTTVSACIMLNLLTLNWSY